MVSSQGARKAASHTLLTTLYSTGDHFFCLICCFYTRAAPLWPHWHPAAGPRRRRAPGWAAVVKFEIAEKNAAPTPNP